MDLIFFIKNMVNALYFPNKKAQYEAHLQNMIIILVIILVLATLIYYWIQYGAKPAAKNATTVLSERPNF